MLFNLAIDLDEKHDVAADYAEKVVELKKLYWMRLSRREPKPQRGNPG